jgi:hypothetical protein
VKYSPTAQRSTVRKRPDPHSIAGEPALHGRGTYPTESVSGEPAIRGDNRATTEEERALHNVWDEPSLRAGGAVAPEEAITYSRWYVRRCAETTTGWSWSMILLLALSGGPFAILGAFVGGFGQGPRLGIFSLVVLAPVMEEMLKIGATLIALENKPYLFRSPAQVLFSILMAASLFATVENILYIYVYHSEGGAEFRAWRWTVCTALHVGATAVSGLGLLHMWKHTVTPIETAAGPEYVRPRAAHAYPYILAAVILHGAYNAFATLMHFTVESF